MQLKQAHDDKIECLKAEEATIKTLGEANANLKEENAELQAHIVLDTETATKQLAEQREKTEQQERQNDKLKMKVKVDIGNLREQFDKIHGVPLAQYSSKNSVT